MGRKSQFPPSVQPGIPRIPKVPSGWKLVPFKDVVKIVQRPVDLEDEQEYQLVTAKRSRGGIVPRERLLGKDILTKTQFYTNSEDFLISRRQIVHGACGIVPKELDNSVVSNEYLVLHTEPKLLKEYLAYFSHTIYFQQTCFHSSIGVDVEKMVFKLEAWLKYKMPLPPIHEQKRIVEILATWDEAIALTERAIEAKQKCKRGFLQQIFKSESYKTFELNEFVDLRREKFNPSPDDDRVCIELEHLSQGTGQLVGSTRSSSQNSTKNVFKPGDVLFGKLRPYLRKFANPNFEGVCSTEIWVLKVKLSLCTSRYLFYLVQTHEFISIANKTSGSKMPRADWGLVAEHPFPLPSLTEQKKIANFLDSLSNEIMLLQSLKDKLESQKRGLMQKLLSGKWRVGIQEAA